MTSISERLKDLRIKNNISQNDLALSLGIKRHTISAYETGSITPPIDKLILISKYYGVSIDYLCGISDSLKNDVNLGLDTYCISKLQKLKSENNLDLLSSLIRYGDSDLFRQAKTYLTKNMMIKLNKKLMNTLLLKVLRIH